MSEAKTFVYVSNAQDGNIDFPFLGQVQVGGRTTREVQEERKKALGAKYLVNPGSVGQPRDGDPRAAYAIVDTNNRRAPRVELFRLAYPVEETQSKIVAAGLADVLAQRLAVGR